MSDVKIKGCAINRHRTLSNNGKKYRGFSHNRVNYRCFDFPAVSHHSRIGASLERFKILKNENLVNKFIVGGWTKQDAV